VQSVTTLWMLPRGYNGRFVVGERTDGCRISLIAEFLRYLATHSRYLSEGQASALPAVAEQVTQVSAGSIGLKGVPALRGRERSKLEARLLFLRLRISISIVQGF